MRLVDIGVNLANERFRKDREALLSRAAAAGIHRLVAIGTSIGVSRQVQQLAQSYPDTVFATIGVHPHDAKLWDRTTPGELRQLAGSAGVVALGEMGLDFNRDFSPRPVQEQVFEAQLEMAAELGLPVYLHERDAHERLVTIIKPWRDRLRAGVVHCFTGSAEELRTYRDLDLHIGITGWICDERRGLHLQELVRTIPGDRLMLETDAPYLLPRTLRPKPKGGRNEPAFLTQVLETVAACRGQSPADVARQTSATAAAFFGW